MLVLISQLGFKIFTKIFFWPGGERVTLPMHHQVPELQQPVVNG